MNNVFVLADGKQYGPYSLEKVSSLVANGVFTKKHLFSADGKDWVSFNKLPNPNDSLPPPPAKLDPNFLQHRGFLLGETANSRLRNIAIYSSVIGFIVHLVLWLCYHNQWIEVRGEARNLLLSPFSALYTPFSILLAYEAYQLIREIPTSFSTSVGKQFEIVTLLVVRDIFKGLSQIKFSDDWTLDGYFNILIIECVTFVILFYTSMNYRKFNVSLMVTAMDVKSLKSYVKSKRNIAVILVFTYLLIATFAFSGWLMGVFNGQGDADREIFFLDFFTILILADILILLIFYKYSDDFYALARNTGFVLATRILRVAIGAPGVSGMALFILSGVLGIIILKITTHFYTPPKPITFTSSPKNN